MSLASRKTAHPHARSRSDARRSPGQIPATAPPPSPRSIPDSPPSSPPPARCGVNLPLGICVPTSPPPPAATSPRAAREIPAPSPPAPRENCPACATSRPRPKPTCSSPSPARPTNANARGYYAANAPPLRVDSISSRRTNPRNPHQSTPPPRPACNRGPRKTSAAKNAHTSRNPPATRSSADKSSRPAPSAWACKPPASALHNSPRQ